MKAEHRKELETNILADRMGRMVQGVKQAPQKKILLYMLLGGAAALLVLILVRGKSVGQQENSAMWKDFYLGQTENFKENLSSAPGKATNFETAYLTLWQGCMIRLATNPREAMRFMDDQSELLYKELAEKCRNDKILQPEAQFGLAVIEETRLVRDPENWSVVRDAYQKVVDEHKDSAYAKAAQQRLDILTDEAKRKDLLQFYNEIRIDDPAVLPPNHPPITLPGKK